jgi:hypothetical protein
MNITRKIVPGLFGICAMLLLAAPALGAEVAAPAWKLSVQSVPTNFPPDSSGEPEYLIVAANVGAAQASGAITIEDTLPTGLKPAGTFIQSTDTGTAGMDCDIVGQAVTCTAEGVVRPGYQLQVGIDVEVEPTAPPSLLNEVSISGGGAGIATAQTTTAIDPAPAPFDFLEGANGFQSPAILGDGSAATQAGSHPYQLNTDLGFPVERPEDLLTVVGGGLRDSTADLPRGLIVNPAASSVLCTERELTSVLDPGCPMASQIGVIRVITSAGAVASMPSPLYNMVPPPGVAASFGFNATGYGIFPHIIGTVRSDGDFGLSGGTNDVLSFGRNPVLGVNIELWGDPGDSSHDDVRGDCGLGTAPVEKCPLEPEDDTDTALVTLPSECSGEQSTFVAHADSWLDPGLFHHATYESADLDGSPAMVNGCNQLEFEPTIEAKPTTNVADSPAGLDFNLHQPQNVKPENHSSAALKDASVTLPEGMTVNPSSAQGQGACSSAEIGLTTPVGASPIRFSKQPDSCPLAAKIGTVTATTPLLGQIDPVTHKVVRDPEGNVVPRPIEGSVYLTKPFDNPFGSLLAIYLSIDDERSGTVAKFAGRVIPDPQTGRLTTVVEDNPQLPIEDIGLHLYGGARGPLVTPPNCGTHTTTSNLTPWSSPEGLDAQPTDSFQTTGAPSGGCPSSAGEAAHAPAFSAGAVAPQAGAFSPFVLKLSREDGSQRLSGIETTLPPGLTARFVGVAECSEAQIAAAMARSHPNEGALERDNPSCPASSQVGTVVVGAGAGPLPLYTEGNAYLAGPYKGAPFSLVIVTPAVAGPFDLGAVVVRTALYVDPTRAQGRAVSDPFPTILEGIPLDIRSVAVKMDRPQFTLNPTSCDPMAVVGTAISTFGRSAVLNDRFQVGGCAALPFKPKLSIRLKGGTKRRGHPALRAVLTAKPGEANIARASVALPRSVFLDQAHIRTVCTRVQFAANACPPGSVYGHARATTPLLETPLEGPVYLRSSDNPLPDLVADLDGRLNVVLAGRIDSIRGGIRNTFDLVPDAPVSKFVLEMQGGKKGLLENSVDLCKGKHRVTILFDGQNGKAYDTRPPVKPDCRGKGGKPGRGGG